MPAKAKKKVATNNGKATAAKAKAKAKATAKPPKQAKVTAKAAKPAAKQAAKPAVAKPGKLAKPTLAGKLAKAVKPAKAPSVVAKADADAKPTTKDGKATEKAARPVPSLMSKVPTTEVRPAEAEEAAGAKPEKKRKEREIVIDRTGNFEQQWSSLFEKAKAVKPVPYKMTDSYEARTPLQHKVLGWGYILSSQNDRLEVLFKDGIKVLIANYKG